MITIITIEPQIGWKDKIKDIFSFEPQNPKYDHSIIFDDNNLLWKEKSIKYITPKLVYYEFALILCLVKTFFLNALYRHKSTG